MGILTRGFVMYVLSGFCKVENVLVGQWNVYWKITRNGIQ